jgi:hypothetical protein
VGALTRRLASAYIDLVRGVDKSHPEWRTPVYRSADALLETGARRPAARP